MVLAYAYSVPMTWYRACIGKNRANLAWHDLCYSNWCAKFEKQPSSNESMCALAYMVGHAPICVESWENVGKGGTITYM